MNSKPVTFHGTDEGPIVEVKILDQRVRAWGLPQYQTAGAAAVDLCACLDEELVLRAQSPAVLIPTGIAVHIANPQFAGLIVPRSGLGHRNGLVMGNLVGVLDADYTGPIMISAWNRNNLGSEPVVVKPGDRVAQLIFIPIARPIFQVVAEFTHETVRGAGGFGSTGLTRSSQ